MPIENENETFRVELHLSNENKQLLLKHFPAATMHVASLVIEIDSDSEIDQPVCLKLSTSNQSEQKQSMVASQIFVPTSVVTGASPEKNNLQETNGQNRETNYDVNEPTVQSPEQQKQLMSSAKFEDPPTSTSNSPPDATLGITLTPCQQQQPGSGPPNVQASCTSKVSSDSTHSEARQKSSSDLLEQAVSEQGGVPEEQSKLVNTLDQFPQFEMEQQAGKKEHTVHCFLHRSELKCNLCPTPEICQSLYDEEFAIQFEQFLERDLNTSLASANNEDTPNNNFLDHVVTHFHADNCPSVCLRLWRYCLDNKLFWVIFKYAPEGFLVYSNSRQNAVGTVVKTYFNYRNVNKIGFGGFGNVYKYSDQMAVKEEFKQPLIAGTGYRSPELFQRIMELDHPHVIKVLEYIAGPYDKDKNKCFLSVMYYKNQKDIQKQFTKKLTCVLDYMKEYRHQEKFIFRNYTVLCRHVFEGLCYLKSKGIIHRDIKPTNILVHQNCACKSPLQCMCAGDGCVTYLLGDMDLLSLEEEGADLTYTYEEWKKMVGHDPAGTIGMKPPESFFRTEKGERMTTHKSDVWSAGVAMMNVLIGKAFDSDIQEKFSKFIEVATEGTKAATKSVTESSKLLRTIMTTFDSVFEQMKKEPSNSELVNNEMIELEVNLHNLKKMLASGGESLSRSQSFQGGLPDIYKEENPLARMLTTAHGARTLHWRCISTLPYIYNTQLWTVMDKTLDAIGAGIKLVPDQREDATTIVNLLKATPPVDFSDSEIEN